MADNGQVARLVAPGGDWNGWRARHPKKRPDLRGATLSHTDLRGADLRGADLRGADLTRSFFLIQAQIETSMGDLDTKLPPSLSCPEHWAGCDSRSPRRT